MQKMLPVLFIFLVSCKENTTISKPQTKFKDSIVKEFLAITDSLEFYDTTDHNFKVLKAYFKNDTGFFRQMQKGIESERKYASADTYFDSWFQLKKLSDLNVDEAYRFHHSQSFCFYNQIVTITRNGGLVSLYYIETSGNPDGRIIKLQTKDGEKNIGPGCKDEKKFFKKFDD